MTRNMLEPLQRATEAFSGGRLKDGLQYMRTFGASSADLLFSCDVADAVASGKRSADDASEAKVDQGWKLRAGSEYDFPHFTQHWNDCIDALQRWVVKHGPQDKLDLSSRPLRRLPASGPGRTT
jgi:hypothetical protein